MTEVESVIAYAVTICWLPLLLIGVIRKGKALMQGRQGPHVLQPFFDIKKLLGKSETVSETAFWVFNAAPIVNVTALIAVAFSTPWLGLGSPINGDLFLLAYLLVAAKLSTSLSALDTGSSFGAIGSSRETALSLFTESAAIAALAALALHAGSSNFHLMFLHVRPNANYAALAALVAVSLWVTSMADLSRMPFDDPTTHLELTMIHEAQILENSGRSLALLEFAAALRTAILIGLTARTVELLLPRFTALPEYLITLLLFVLAATVIAVTEVVLVRLRWRRLPNLLSFAVGTSMIACLIAALRI
jgi:formate hydrogenlyase subunit 4